MYFGTQIGNADRVLAINNVQREFDRLHIVNEEFLTFTLKFVYNTNTFHDFFALLFRNFFRGC